MSGLDVILYWSALTTVAGLFIVPNLPAGYMAVCGVLLVAAPVLLFVAPDIASWLVLALTAVFVLIPIALALSANLASRRERNGLAWIFSLTVLLLHPFDGWRTTAHVFRALALRQRGAKNAAHAIFEREAAADTPLGLLARMQLCETRHDFALLADDPRLMRDDPATVLFRLRVLGELGRIADMVGTYRAALARRPPLPLGSEAPRLLIVLGFAGRPQGVAALYRGPLAGVPAAVRDAQVARAQLAAGGPETAEAWATLRALSAGPDATARRTAARTLSEPPLPVGPLDAADHALLDAIEHHLLAAPPRQPWWRSVATLVLIAANLGMFAAESRRGGTADGDTLYALGGLYTVDFGWRADGWRLFTEMFLHAGAIHIAVNMVGLLVLGILVERMLGAWWFLLLYLGAGLGANVAIVLLAQNGLVRPELLVGASGALMGLVGGLEGSALRQWLATRQPLFLQRFVRIAFILILQTAIDLTIPQVSAATHLSGAAVGFVLGWMLPFSWPPSPWLATLVPAAPRSSLAAAPTHWPLPRRALTATLAATSIVASLVIAAHRA